MMMKSFSFESPKPHLFAQYLKNSIQALLRCEIKAQSNPILHHTEANGCIFFWLAVELITLSFFPNFLWLSKKGNITDLAQKVGAETCIIH